MNRSPFIPRQRGAVLVIGMIVLMLITLMVTAAFKFSTYNLKSVGNMQSRNEAIASANKAIEQVIGSWNFRSTPVADHITVDIDNDGTNDYVVDLTAPVCVKAVASRGAATSGDECITTLDGVLICSKPPPAEYALLWELDAVATSSSSGTRVRVRQGVSKPGASQGECDSLCPPAAGVACK